MKIRNRDIFDMAINSADENLTDAVCKSNTNSTKEELQDLLEDVINSIKEAINSI